MSARKGVERGQPGPRMPMAYLSLLTPGGGVTLCSGGKKNLLTQKYGSVNHKGLGKPKKRLRFLHRLVPGPHRGEPLAPKSASSF
jgi:hypothetical protein